MAFGLPEHEWRSIAAKEGWKTRRAGVTPWRRFLALIPQLENAPVRLFCCDLAEQEMHRVDAAYPDDPRPRLALWMARRYAHGQATEKERLGMRQVTIGMALEVTGNGIATTPAEHALFSTFWCLEKSNHWLLWDVVHHVGKARGHSNMALADELLPALEALPRKECCRTKAA